MTSYKISSKGILLDLLFRLCNPIRNERGIPIALEHVLNDCKTLEAVLDLYFTTDFPKDEGVILAFERRIYQLS
jgi:hypothetical protein